MNQPVKNKPQLSFWQIWNMCFGFLGIQFGFALQNSNVSRIFQTLGAEIENVPILWVAAPLTGLIVQPVVGYFSDNTWNKLGRRRPYFLWGALATTFALILMPNSPSLWIAAGALWILDASINITMEPFRAFVGDMLPRKQRAFGYVMQTIFIGIGAVVASALPYILANWMGVDNTAPAGEIPDSVRYSFYFGAGVLFCSVLWTVIRTREYSPEQLAAFEAAEKDAETLAAERDDPTAFAFSPNSAWIWMVVASVASLAVFLGSWDPQLYLLTLGALVYGMLQLIAARLERGGKITGGFYQACRSVVTMPETMRQLAVVQFFSWFPLFAMWIYSTAAVSSHHFGSSDPQSAAYNAGADWVGVLFAAYNGFAVFAAMLIPIVARYAGLKTTHQINLVLGAAGLASFLVIDNPDWLLLSMVGVGFAWASILSIPYALLADALPANKMGIYMGVFNFFIVIPQLIAASVLGLALKFLFDGEAVQILLLAAILWLVAAASVFRVKVAD